MSKNFLANYFNFRILMPLGLESWMLYINKLPKITKLGGFEKGNKVELNISSTCFWPP